MVNARSLSVAAAKLDSVCMLHALGIHTPLCPCPSGLEVAAVGPQVWAIRHVLIVAAAHGDVSRTPTPQVLPDESDPDLEPDERHGAHLYSLSLIHI